MFGSLDKFSFQCNYSEAKTSRSKTKTLCRWIIEWRGQRQAKMNVLAGETLRKRQVDQHCQKEWRGRRLSPPSYASYLSVWTLSSCENRHVQFDLKPLHHPEIKHDFSSKMEKHSFEENKKKCFKTNAIISQVTVMVKSFQWKRMKNFRPKHRIVKKMVLKKMQKQMRTEGGTPGSAWIPFNFYFDLSEFHYQLL